MTVSVVTGKPGHGKTLYAVTKIEALAKEQNRQVYYNGIEGLTLDWLPLDDATQWHNPEHVPDGAIIVIDEAQRVFPPRSTGSRVPAHVQPFDTHRHRGLDVYLITQDPMLIDSFARNLAGEHIHVLRPFGTQQAKIFRWEHVVDPDSRSERNLAVDTSFFRYPKESFDRYKSATVHTVKRKLPWKLAVGLPILLAVLALSIVIGYKTLNNLKAKDAGKDAAVAGSSDLVTVDGAKALSPDDYKKTMIARIPGVPESAPHYDDLAKPTVLPVMAGCVQMAESCTCYTQQGTKIQDADKSACSEFIGNGRFVAFDDKTLGRPEKKASLSPAEIIERDLQIMKLQDQLSDYRRGLNRQDGQDVPAKKNT